MKLTDVKLKNGRLPETPGVYLMKDAAGRLLYVGKAANLKRRVSSYFQKAHDGRIERLVSEIGRIDYEGTATAIEALIREAELIKKFEPPFNVREKDDKSFLYVLITKEKFPRVLLVRGKDLPAQGTIYGPFTSAKSLREAMRLIRKIFPWNDHAPGMKPGRPCFNYQIGLCPGICAGLADQKEYRKTVAALRLFFEGKRKRVVAAFEKAMQAASRRLDFETAEKYRRRLFALQHIQDVALISEDEIRDERTENRRSVRIEGYDISNISGTSAVGSMVVFSARGGLALGGENFRPQKGEYRKFRIRGPLWELVGRMKRPRINPLEETKS